MGYCFILITCISSQAKNLNKLSFVKARDITLLITSFSNQSILNIYFTFYSIL